MSELLDELDKIASAGSGLAKNFGWIADAYIQQRAKEEQGVPYRTVLTETLDELSKRYASHMSRTTIADRVRVMRFFTRDRVAELPGNPAFNHLRACYVGNTWPDADEAKTMDNVKWAIEHSVDGTWPTPYEIRTRGGVEEDENEKMWKSAVKACRRVVENPLIVKQRRDAARYVTDLEAQ